MKEYLDYVLSKAKKPCELMRIYNKIEECMRVVDPNYSLNMKDKEEINHLLEEGVSNYEYIKYENGKYSSLKNSIFRKGIFNGYRNGAGYVSVIKSYIDNNGEENIYIDKVSIDLENANGAIDGDNVLIKRGSNGVKPKIVEIINRDLDYIVGEVYRVGRSYFVKPIDKKKQFLTIALENEAIEGARVLVNLNKMTNNNYYIGEVKKVFNHKDDPDSDILWEAYKCGIETEFSPGSLEQVKSIPFSVRESDKIGRSDLTNWEVFTIDGVDTKDIDDAISLKKLDNGNYLLGVHIADVSSYVFENSFLDRDAYKRGNSYYLAGKVIPMLPHELSNGICSLNPYVERLTLSCLMEINKEGEVVSHDIIPSVIKSSLKMNYDSVNKVLKGEDFPLEYMEHVDTLKMMNHLAHILNNNRKQKGSVEFLRDELKLIYNDNKEIEGFSLRKQDDAEKLIQEFMLICNETVDKDLESRGFPSLHRVHDRPNKEKLDDFFRMLDCLNIPFNKYSSLECSNSGRALQDLADYIKSTGRISNMLSSNLIKCMSRAKYSPVNIGHMGLAKKNYCHFTSPIRRYADLTIHRIVKDSRNSDRDKSIHKWNLKLNEIGMQVSKTEKMADEAEENTLKMKCSEYMANHLGDEFNGTIVGLSDHGIRVELDNMIEGRVRIKDLDGDYVYNSNTYTLLSLGEGENYSIGDRLKLKAVYASKEDKVIDFSISEKIQEVKMVDNIESNNIIKAKALQKK